MGRPKKNKDLGEGIGIEAVGVPDDVTVPEPEGKVKLGDESSLIGSEIGGKKIISHSSSGGVHILMDTDGASFTLTDDEVKHYVKT